MKRIFILSIAILLMASASAQVTYDDRVYLNQLNEQYPGFFSTTYQGLYPTGHSQFKMFNLEDYQEHLQLQVVTPF